MHEPTRVTVVANQQGLLDRILVVTDHTTFVRMYRGSTTDSERDLQTGEPRLAYARRILDVLGVAAGQHVLVIGGAGHAMAHGLERRGALVTEVELDPVIVELSDRFFGPLRGQVVVTDGRVYLEHCAASVFDGVIIDAFDAHGVVPHLSTKACFSDVRRALRDGGRLVMNVVGVPATGCDARVERVRDAMFEVFGNVEVIGIADDQAKPQNVLLVASLG